MGNGKKRDSSHRHPPHGISPSQLYWIQSLEHEKTNRHIPYFYFCHFHSHLSCLGLGYEIALPPDSSYRQSPLSFRIQSGP